MAIAKPTMGLVEWMSQADVSINALVELTQRVDPAGVGLSRGTIKNARRGDNITMRAAEILIRCSRRRPVRVEGRTYCLSYERLVPGPDLRRHIGRGDDGEGSSAQREEEGALEAG